MTTTTRIRPVTPNPAHASGHQSRTGHRLILNEATADGVLWHYVYTCCGESTPEVLTTWADMTPTRPTPIRSG